MIDIPHEKSEELASIVPPNSLLSTLLNRAFINLPTHIRTLSANNICLGSFHPNPQSPLALFHSDEKDASTKL